MPSGKPTIAVRMKPHVFEVFKRLAELQGRSRGSVVADILESVYPPLMRTVALLEAARDAPAQVRGELKRLFESVEQEVVGAAGSSLAQMDMLIERLGERPETGRRTVPGAAAKRTKKVQKGGSTPVPVTRGSGGQFVQQSAGRKRSAGER
jgi:hypothetical protein